MKESEKTRSMLRPTSMFRPAALVGLMSAGVLALAACGSDDSLAADAGADQTITVGESPTFDGCGSTGSINNYAWTIESAPADMADDAGKVIRESMNDCSFTLEAAMLTEEAGVWTVRLTVTDGDAAEATDTVDITVEP